MTNMAPPKGPVVKDQPPTLLELLDAIERHLDTETAKRDVCQSEFGPSKVRDREVRCLELIAEIVYTVSCDKERYREFAIDVRAKFPRWLKPADRRKSEAETLPAADEEKASDE